MSTYVNNKQTINTNSYVHIEHGDTFKGIMMREKAKMNGENRNERGRHMSGEPRITEAIVANVIGDIYQGMGVCMACLRR